MNMPSIVFETEIVACEVCLKEIPVSEARSEEASDYVHYYCGLDCFSEWRGQEQKVDQEGTG